MGNKQTINNKVNFEDIMYAVKNNNYMIINVLDVSQQSCLIVNTIPYENEENIINQMLESKKSCNIIIYGKNCNDEKLIFKYNQLITLGFYNVYIYYGGLFEWLMLQDIYGNDNFKTTKKCDDILFFKPKSILENINYLEN